MIAPTTQRPASVGELQRAWVAVLDGEFRQSRLASPRCGAAAWTPAPDESVIPVLGAAGSVGTSTVALALATAYVETNVGSQTRVIECCPATASGLSAASTAELGAHASGWMQGKRDQVLIERSAGSGSEANTYALPAPLDDQTQAQDLGTVTFLDPGGDIYHVINGRSWPAKALCQADTVVVVARPTVPGFRRLESTLDVLADQQVKGQPFIAVVGPPRRKWAKCVQRSAGRRLRAALHDDRVFEFPEDSRLALSGLTSAPLPHPLLAAARRLLAAAQINTDSDSEGTDRCA